MPNIKIVPEKDWAILKKYLTGRARNALIHEDVLNGLPEDKREMILDMSQDIRYVVGARQSTGSYPIWDRAKQAIYRDKAGDGADSDTIAPIYETREDAQNAADLLNDNRKFKPSDIDDCWWGTPNVEVTFVERPNHTFFKTRPFRAAEALPDDDGKIPVSDTLSIYQAKVLDVMYASYDTIQQKSLEVRSGLYTKVYTGHRRPGEKLDDIFVRFNLHKPSEFRGHSLSVSDVVVLHAEEGDRAYFVDSIGFRFIPGFFEEEK